MTATAKSTKPLSRRQLRESVRCELMEIRTDLADMSLTEQEWSPADREKWEDLKREETRFETALKGLQ